MAIGFKAFFCDQRSAARNLQVGCDHLFYQLRKRSLRLPAKFRFAFAWIAKQSLNLGRPEITRIDLDDGLAVLTSTLLFDAFAAPLDAHIQVLTGQFANSRTECCSPVAITKVFRFFSLASINHCAST